MALPPTTGIVVEHCYLISGMATRLVLPVEYNHTYVHMYYTYNNTHVHYYFFFALMDMSTFINNYMHFGAHIY